MVHIHDMSKHYMTLKIVEVVIVVCYLGCSNSLLDMDLLWKRLLKILSKYELSLHSNQQPKGYKPHRAVSSSLVTRNGEFYHCRNFKTL